MPNPPMIPPRSSVPGSAPSDSGRRFVVGISGASGALYPVRLTEQLLLRGHTVHLVVSEYAKRLLIDEMEIQGISLETFCPHLAESAHASAYAERLVIHPNKDVGAVIASGSYLHDGMAVLPCSSTTLGAIATGSGSNLLCRAAAVTIKERRPLVVCHREMPLSLIDIENMRTLALAGAINCPTNPGLYLRPTTIDEIIDFQVGKVLDLLKVEHDLKNRWEDHA